MPELEELLRERVARDIAETTTPPFAELRARAVRRRRKTLASLAVGGTVVVAFAGAGLALIVSNDADQPSQVGVPSDTRFSLPGDQPRQGVEAGATGTLRFTDNDCPYLEQRLGWIVELNFPTDWAIGVRHSDATRSIVGADGRVWGREGERVLLGGGPPMDRSTFVDCGAPKQSSTGKKSTRFVAEDFTTKDPG